MILSWPSKGTCPLLRAEGRGGAGGQPEVETTAARACGLAALALGGASEPSGSLLPVSKRVFRQRWATGVGVYGCGGRSKTSEML